jgi:hypothetical protein
MYHVPNETQCGLENGLETRADFETVFANPNFIKNCTLNTVASKNLLVKKYGCMRWSKGSKVDPSKYIK